MAPDHQVVERRDVRRACNRAAARACNRDRRRGAPKRDCASAPQLPVRERLTNCSHSAGRGRSQTAVGSAGKDRDPCGADDVVGIKTYVYDLGNGIIEFMAIGTAVKQIPGLTTTSPELPTQAVISDKDTLVNTAECPRKIVRPMSNADSVLFLRLLK